MDHRASAQLALRPYVDPRDNRLEVACLLLLLYGYFVSVLPSASSVMDATVSAAQMLLVSYAVYRWDRLRRGRGDADDCAPAAWRAGSEIGDPAVHLSDQQLELGSQQGLRKGLLAHADAASDDTDGANVAIASDAYAH
jgi:hypothetical protein